ncbi:P-selectin glycoprotein ligand 1 precursor [Canis lupus familiaris]|uniref:p-selectin glycoprotein ligand-1 n=1 Tax=Canis lupus familiaris TaxID=9615 RepID=F7J212_CANLF|nr:P-selectin glycoprotein ligand 1 precursor [Canis lupus familiaris]BAK39910.1 P-selectin glycoprotein ligand-1 [Canis lupus familiaris]|eukprot:NP_001229648.1 P-selectin glycoprotein ligand 1 precursor [Canis lupus familiaris]
MPLQVLLLLVLLGSGDSLQPWEIQRSGTEEAPELLLARGRRQVDEELELDVYDYSIVGTDAPELLTPESMPLTPKLLAEMAMLGQRNSTGHGTPEPATLEAATGDSAGLDAGGVTMGNLSMEVATQDFLTEEPATTLLPTTEAPLTEGAPTTELATTEVLSTEPAATEALTTQPVATEAQSMEPIVVGTLSTGPEVTEALTTQLAATEAQSMEPIVMGTLSTGPEVTEALTTQPAATEAQSMEPIVMGTLSTGPGATDALSTEPAATKAPSTDPATVKGPSTTPASTGHLTTVLVPSDPQNSTNVTGGDLSDAFIKRWKNSQGLPPPSSAVPPAAEGPDRIPVKQCLLAILVLALVATTFLVCTVVLAVRLSRKTHVYPVRSYSPTEMVCISSLLPEGGEAPTPTAAANGGLPDAKSQGLRAEPREGRDGDDLTLQSFLP